MSSVPVSLSWRHGVAVITIDNPPVNAINQQVRLGLLTALREIAGDLEVEAAVIVAAGSTFMAGSDIREFDASPQEPILYDVINHLEALSIPVVAAIQGAALGGGFEIALGCHYRVAAKTAKVGLPEVNLGIIPGAGGTQRLPRLIGVEKALDWIITGRHIKAADALAAGAIDAIAEGDVLEAGLAMALKLASGSTIKRSSKLPVPALPSATFFHDQRKVATKRLRGLTAPLAVIDAVEAATVKPFAAGLQFELNLSRKLKASDQSRALRHLFFGERDVARIPDLPAETPLRSIATVGVIGAGTMGRGIVLACLNAGFNVIWVDRAEDLLARGVEAINSIYQRDVEKGRLTLPQHDERLDRLDISVPLEPLSVADLVIEAAFENMDVKQGLFRDLDRVCKPGAILATNTSTLNVDEIARVTSRPADVIGLHFFSPAHVMRLLEVVRGADTGKDVVATAMKFGKQIGKVAVLSGVCFGFIGNRMFEGYVRESQMLLLQGCSPAQVDQALTDFGMAMGPCAVIDLAGVDVSYLTREGNRTNLPPDPCYCAVGDQLHQLGRFGQKTGKGFYRYVDGKPEPDPEVDAIIRAEAARLGVSPRAVTPDEIVARCLYPLINEGARILEEGIALRAIDIDVVWAFGYGFPRYRGGPMFHAGLIGLNTIAAGMADFARILGNDYGYWTSAPLLAKLAAGDKTFQDWGRV